MSDAAHTDALEGRTYLILGAAGGIGSALARRLASRGADLVLAGRRPAPLEELQGEIGGRIATLDARDFTAVEDAVRMARGDAEALSGAANCVGSILLKPAHLTSPEDFEETVGQNLRTAFALVRAVGRVAARDEGSISLALVSTAAARVGLPNHEAIAAAKAGVEGLTRSAAATYARSGIRVNAVAPGLVDTPLASRITGSERALETSRALHPVGRIGRPGDVARLLEWLLDPAQDWVTGQIFGVDGGMSTVRAG